MFARHLRDIGDEFRREQLDSTDPEDKTELEDWIKMKVGCHYPESPMSTGNTFVVHGQEHLGGGGCCYSKNVLGYLQICVLIV